MAIPKVIHYFWFGKNKLPDLARKCLKSWKKYCPDYEIKLWNEDNFDIHCIPFVEQAYEARKFAFVTDFARFYILNKEGGIYIETDTELLRSIDEFLNDGVFLGLGKDDVTFCVFGMEKNHPLSASVLEYYKERQFTIGNNLYDMTTVNFIIHKILIEQYGLVHKDEFQRLKNNICIYPTKYFLTDWSYGTLNNKNSYAFHYSDGSWLTDDHLRDQKKIIIRCVRIFGKKLGWDIGNVIYYLKYNGFKQTYYKCMEKLYLKLNPIYVAHCPLKIKKNKVIFCNFNGQGYGYDPKCICEQLRKSGKYDLVWAVKDKKKNNGLPPEVRAVRFKSLRYYIDMSTAKVWVDDVRKGSEIRKRPGQYYLQTWHGSIPLKKLEKDAIQTLTRNYIEDAIHDSSMIDAIPSSCQTRSELIHRAFWYDGDILEVGCPRNDIFFKTTVKDPDILKHLGIDAQTKLAVYAPTFRQNMRIEAYDLDFEKVKVALEKKFGGKFAWVIRLHPNLREVDIHESFGKNVFDGSQFEDAQQLFASSDILVSDYSDCLFEMALSGKPVFIYASDLKSYMNERDLYNDLRNLPFSIAETTEEMEKNIVTFNYFDYSKKLKQFWSEQGLYEDGSATDKLVSWIQDKCV